VIVIVSAIVGNVLVCIAVCISSSLRRATSSYFIFSLALSDIGTASLSMPFDLEALTLSGCWPKGRGEGLCIVWTVTYLITVPTSILNLFALSVDRYKTLRDPWDRFKESPSMTPRRAVAIIVFIWVYCLLFALVPVLGVQYYGPQTLLYGRCIFNISPTTSMVSSFLNFYLPMFAMCWIYYRIYQIAHTQYNIPTGLEKHDYSIVKPTSSLSQIGADKKSGIRKKRYRVFVKNTKAARTIAIIVSAYLTCWVPFTTISIVVNLCEGPCWDAIPNAVWAVLMLVGYLNSALNPLLFSHQNPHFRRAYRRMLRALCSCC
ncbi:predicted protein, partial [Nematostella vectensis]